MSVKLYLDADITAAPLLASTLRQRGFDVISAVEVDNDALEDGLLNLFYFFPATIAFLERQSLL